MFAYVHIRLVLPFAVGRAVKIAVGAGLFLVSQVHLLNKILVPGWPAPELPAWALMAEGGLFLGLVLLFFSLLARDLARLARRFIGRSKLGREQAVSLSRRRFLVKGALGLPAAYGAKQALAAGMILAPAAYGVSRGVAVPDIRSTRVALPSLPRSLDGLVIAQISDTHISPLLRENWARELVDKVNGCSPDIIVITGDLVDGLPDNRADAIAPFRKFQARYGVFACPGNHEYYAGYAAWMDVFRNLGIRMLCNDHASLGINGADLVIAGLTDSAAEQFSLPAPDLAAALRGSPENGTRILLDHRPGNAALNSLHGVALQLSGHTHGGHMIGMDGLVSLFNQGFVRGWYKADTMPLYVNSGAGLWNGFPVRLGVPSEIARITLHGVV